MSFWQSIDRPIIGLSPMDGVTDPSFRFITAKHGGPDVIFSEFVNVETAFYAPHTLIRDLSYAEIERPVIAQIYGKTVEMFYQVAHMVCELGFDGLDINMGCPARKVAAAGCGAALILNPDLARAILRAARQGIHDWYDGQTLSDLKTAPELILGIRHANRMRTGADSPSLRRLIPLSVKTRIGYDRIAVEEWIQTLLEERPAVISLHGRTLKQGYKGNADWDAIGRAAELTRRTETFILGNGDLRDMAEVCRRVRETNVDGVLLGRAAQGNPWIFRDKNRVKQSLRSAGAVLMDSVPVALDERFKVMTEHGEHFEKFSQVRSFVGMRKHLAWYCHDFPRSAQLRSQMVRINDSSELVACLKNYPLGPGSRFDGWDDRPAPSSPEPCAPDP